VPGFESSIFQYAEKSENLQASSKRTNTDLAIWVLCDLNMGCIVTSVMFLWQALCWMVTKRTYFFEVESLDSFHNDFSNRLKKILIGWKEIIVEIIWEWTIVVILKIVKNENYIWRTKLITSWVQHLCSQKQFSFDEVFCWPTNQLVTEFIRIFKNMPKGGLKFWTKIWVQNLWEPLILHRDSYFQ
jgi:hypothetical protein